MNNDMRLVITKHAIERGQEFQLSIPKLGWMFWHSEEEPKPPNAHKREVKGQTTIFRRCGTHVMVVGITKDRVKNDDIYLLLTIYNQEMDLKAPYLYR